MRDVDDPHRQVPEDTLPRGKEIPISEIRFLVFTLVSVVGVALGIAAVGFVLDFKDCREIARAGHQTSYGFRAGDDDLSGCYVREGGKWVPVAEWREGRS